MTVAGGHHLGRYAKGRPVTDAELVALVLRFSRENETWGYRRISGALANSGHKLSASTVRRILKDHGLAPAPRRKRELTWHAFIEISAQVEPSCLGRLGQTEQAEKLARELDREKGDQEQVNHYTMLVWMVLGQSRGLDDTIFSRSIQRWAERNEDNELKELLASIGEHQCQLE